MKSTSDEQSGDVRAGGDGRLTFADRLDRLFQAAGNASLEIVAAKIRRRGDGAISASYLWLLRKGVKDNPTKRHLEALARFFGVSPAYIFDEALTEQHAADLALLAALGDADIRAVTLHAKRLSTLGRRALVTLGEQLAQINHQFSDGRSDAGQDKAPYGEHRGG